MVTESKRRYPRTARRIGKGRKKSGDKEKEKKYLGEKNKTKKLEDKTIDNDDNNEK